MEAAQLLVPVARLISADFDHKMGNSTMKEIGYRGDLYTPSESGWALLFIGLRATHRRNDD